MLLKRNKYKSFLQGTRGAKGVKGEKGEEGPTGPSGKEGLQGLKGEPGAKVPNAANSLRQTQKKNIHYLAYCLLAFSCLSRFTSSVSRVVVLVSPTCRSTD